VSCSARWVCGWPANRDGTPRPLIGSAPIRPTRPLSITRALILIAAMSTGTGCVTTTGGGSFCAIYEPVWTDDATPEPVQREIDRNNLAHCRLCDPACPV
jgi:hypothetical protein